MNSDRARRASPTLKRFTTWVNYRRRRNFYQMVLVPMKKLDVVHPPISILQETSFSSRSAPMRLDQCEFNALLLLPRKEPDSTLDSALRTSLTTHTKLYTFRFRQYSPRPTLLFQVGVDVDFAIARNE